VALSVIICISHVVFDYLIFLFFDISFDIKLITSSFYAYFNRVKVFCNSTKPINRFQI